MIAPSGPILDLRYVDVEVNEATTGHWLHVFDSRKFSTENGQNRAEVQRSRLNVAALRKLRNRIGQGTCLGFGPSRSRLRSLSDNSIQPMSRSSLLVPCGLSQLSGLHWNDVDKTCLKLCRSGTPTLSRVLPCGYLSNYQDKYTIPPQDQAEMKASVLGELIISN